MKIKTDLHAGHILEDAYSYVSEALATVPQFIRRADDETEMLYQQAADSTQALWGKLTSSF